MKSFNGYVKLKEIKEVNNINQETAGYKVLEVSY